MKILLVEDEKEICRVYEEILNGCGYKVHCCYDGDSGTEEALKGEWDILLLDIMLPNKDGLEILEDVYKAGLTNSKKVIVLSNIEKDDVLKKATSMGAMRYVIKSEVNPNELVEIISSL
jgi:DNA-binding response OmpR family regulator